MQDPREISEQRGARPDCASLGLPHQDSAERPDFCCDCDAVYLRWVGWVSRPQPQAAA